jgi:hypothetical protein
VCHAPSPGRASAGMRSRRFAFDPSIRQLDGRHEGKYQERAGAKRRREEGKGGRGDEAIGWSVVLRARASNGMENIFDKIGDDFYVEWRGGRGSSMNGVNKRPCRHVSKVTTLTRRVPKARAQASDFRSCSFVRRRVRLFNACRIHPSYHPYAPPPPPPHHLSPTLANFSELFALSALPPSLPPSFPPFFPSASPSPPWLSA